MSSLASHFNQGLPGCRNKQIKWIQVENLGRSGTAEMRVSWDVLVVRHGFPTFAFSIVELELGQSVLAHADC